MKTNTRILLLGVITDALPAPGTGAVWKYKAIYLQGDDRAGQWSDVVSIPVAG